MAQYKLKYQLQDSERTTQDKRIKLAEYLESTNAFADVGINPVTLTVVTHDRATQMEIFKLGMLVGRAIDLYK